MPKYYGCPCEGCGRPLTLQDDIVVCPDCGSPYHRSCYEKLGMCVHAPAHANHYEWHFPYQDSELRTCPACGERTLRSEERCRCCGADMPPEGQAQPNDRAAAESEQNGAFDYAGMYRQFGQTGSAADPMRQATQAAFGAEQMLDGIPCQDWMDYIGPSASTYLADYGRMQLQNSKTSMCFSALLFGPFYFFYRKAWKPAFAFLAAELLLAAPTFISMLQISESPLAPALSASALVLLARICSVLSFVLMILRGMFGKWFYRKSAAEQIRRIRKDFPDAAKRRVVLAAQGGVSWAAVVGAFVLLMVVGGVASLALGPNLDALLSAMYS
ncbi:MAG: RING finger protein [Faecalibacterium sp.]